MGKKISKELREQIHDIAKEVGDQLASSVAASSSAVAAAEPPDEVFEFRVRLTQMSPAEILYLQQRLRQAEEDTDGNIRFEGKRISRALRKQYMRMSNEEMGKRGKGAGKGGGVAVRR